jgi:hypothetical protein
MCPALAKRKAAQRLPGYPRCLGWPTPFHLRPPFYKLKIMSSELWGKQAVQPPTFSWDMLIWVGQGPQKATLWCTSERQTWDVQELLQTLLTGGSWQVVTGCVLIVSSWRRKASCGTERDWKRVSWREPLLPLGFPGDPLCFQFGKQRKLQERDINRSNSWHFS